MNDGISDCEREKSRHNDSAQFERIVMTSPASSGGAVAEDEILSRLKKNSKTLENLASSTINTRNNNNKNGTRNDYDYIAILGSVINSLECTIDMIKEYGGYD